MSEFLGSNEWQWRLARTIVQGVIGVLVANVDLIVGWCVVEPQVRGLQAWLNARGLDCGEVDGVLGPRTAMAVQRSLNAGAWSE